MAAILDAKWHPVQVPVKVFFQGRPCSGGLAAFHGNRAETAALVLPAAQALAERRVLSGPRLTDLIQQSLGTFGTSAFAEARRAEMKGRFMGGKKKARGTSAARCGAEEAENRRALLNSRSLRTCQHQNQDPSVKQPPPWLRSIREATKPLRSP